MKPLFSGVTTNKYFAVLRVNSRRRARTLISIAIRIGGDTRKISTSGVTDGEIGNFSIDILEDFDVTAGLLLVIHLEGS